MSFGHCLVVVVGGAVWARLTATFLSVSRMPAVATHGGHHQCECGVNNRLYVNCFECLEKSNINPIHYQHSCMKNSEKLILMLPLSFPNASTVPLFSRLILERLSQVYHYTFYSSPQIGKLQKCIAGIPGKKKKQGSLWRYNVIVSHRVGNLHSTKRSIKTPCLVYISGFNFTLNLVWGLERF